MYSEYASKFLSQSRGQLSSSRSEAPLFYSTIEEDNEDLNRNNTPGTASVYGSSSRKWASSFVPKYIRGDSSRVSGVTSPYRSNGSNVGIKSDEEEEDDDGDDGDDLLGLHDDIKVNMISSTSDVEDSIGGHFDGGDGDGDGDSSQSTIGNKRKGRNVLESIQLDDDEVFVDEPPEDIVVEGRRSSSPRRGNIKGKGRGRGNPSIKRIEEDEEDEEDEDNDDSSDDNIRYKYNNTNNLLNDEESQIGMRVFIPPDFLPNGGDNNGMTHHIQSQNSPPILSPENPSIKFDSIWANIYLAFVSMVLATSLMIWFTTSIPKSAPLGDTIYTIIKSSWALLFIYTFTAIMISILWVYFINHYASFSIYSLLIIVPVGLLSLTLYPFIMSFNHNTSGSSQRSAMRWTSFIPLLLCIGWIYILYKGKHALTRSLGIIKLSCSILSENRPLIFLSATIIFIFTLISILWINLFSRLFLQGHTIIDHGKATWVLDPKSWLLGACYILMYLWTWGVINGIHRTTITATVAQWYFHRHEPYFTISTLRIIQASLQHSVTTQFGTICFSSLLVLLARLPILILPSRLSTPLQMIVYTFISRTSILSLTSPLALTNATINTQKLIDSAHTITTIMYSDSLNKKSNRIKRSWVPYRLSKILLTACRGLTALSMGFGAWIHTASYPSHGSLYGYIVGLLAGFTGWVIIGATEGTLSMIVDATFICFALDNYSSKGGHCVEADRQFGGH